jgi:hypothetical protein
MLIVHARRPIGEDIRQFSGIDNAKSEINVRPLVFTFGRSRPSDRGTTDATVTRGAFKEGEAQMGAFFRRKHRVFPDSGNVFNSIATSRAAAAKSSSSRIDLC